MAAQAALIEETIIGLKRALRRENDYTGPDEPITQPTNRGNKLRVNAKYVQEGALGFSNPREFYKQKIDHAGYTRYILRRNPPRYDSEGDEIDENEDADSEIEAAAAEENPFSEIALEDILCPLKQASELPDHPSLSQPYRSNALPTMIKAVDEKLRNERALLARAHNLHRQFLGDSIWMPCGMVESEDDPFIFRPRPAGDFNKQQANLESRTDSDQVENYINGDNAHIDTESGTRDERNSGDDIEMTEAPVSAIGKDLETKRPKEEDVSSVKGLPSHSEHGGVDPSARVNENGAISKDSEINKKEQGSDIMGASPQVLDNEIVDTIMQDTAAESRTVRNNEGNSSPEPPRRMTTRARANTSPSNGNGISGSSRYTSPDVAASSAHPIFLVSENIRPDKDFGLPPNEAEDTRRLLWSYIQKQEETVRGFTYMLNSLRRAEQLRQDVFESCKAEGHVGELSDGEDWYDREKWGLAEGEDLKKGADDDDVDNNVDEVRTTGKRGRRRQ